MRANRFEISKFVCPECGNEFPIPRPKARRRKKDHIKDLYCPFCKQVVKTVEVREKDRYTSIDGSVVY